MTASSDFSWLPLAAVRPWLKNPRKNQKAVPPVAESLQRFGFVNPVVIWASGDRMVAGHTRVLALQSLLAKDPAFTPRGAPGPGVVPVRFAEFTSEAEADAYALADNKLGEIAQWDDDALVGILKDLQAADEALVKAAGFTDGDLARLLRTTEPGDDEGAEDPSEALQGKWATEAGQIWVIPSKSVPGRSHRLLCGDSTDALAVERLRAGDTWRLMVTDPPYGVEYDPTWRDHINRGSTKMTGKVENDDKADWSSVWALWAPEVAYVWHADRFAGDVVLSLARADMMPKALIIWRKPSMVLGRSDYHWQHEPCWYTVKKGCKSGWCGDRTQTTMWDIAGMGIYGGSRSDDDVKTNHGTQKPLECMARPIRNHFEPGTIVCDPFLGSGTSLAAAERERRICYGAELSPGYVAVILERLAKMGLEPRLET